VQGVKIMTANCYEFIEMKKKAREMRELAKTIENFGKCDYSVWDY
jgi:hypothetical protein